ncbi:MAG: alpha/beta hydrolase [Nanobdellota archaeon]
MKNKIQVLIVHGGTTFKTKKEYLSFLKNKPVSVKSKTRWSDDFLKKKLGKRFEIIKPTMPLKQNAKYNEWKIYFEKFIPFLNDDIILIGESLGGVFLAKYLSENKFPKKILSTYLVCPPYDNSLPGEDLVGGFKLQSDLSLLEKNSRHLYVIFSKDDDVVPVSHAEKYRKKLNDATIIIYESKNGHFQISKFPEIVKMIKSDVAKK